MRRKDTPPAHDKSEEIDDTPWKVTDEYRFAPSKPEGDPWRVILDPLLEEDQIRCEGWKDEVGNLLIFAGLFSAVVTAFIIESYKSLLPDANNDIVTLLSQIANEKNNNNQTSPTLPSRAFSPTRSVVRVNIFWFLSLVFSLAVVLIGIVALQWLREHQSYPGKSPRETLTMYRMRSEGTERWHVWKILMALPLLLQIALVLFFAGIIDFLDALGNTALVVSVSVAIGLILAFLVATTTSPALQVLVLYIRSMFPPNISRPPSQCPYKSPQAHVFCGLCDISTRLPRSIVSGIWLRLYDLCWKYSLTRTREHLDRLRSFFQPAWSIPRARLHLSTLWAKRTWTDFDQGWLWLRDACARGAHDRAFDLFPDQQEDNTHIMPLFDCVGAVREHLWNMSGDGYEPDLVHDAYHCFVDLSQTFSVNEIASHYWLGHLRDLLRRNQYLQFSVEGNTAISEDCSAFDHLTLETDSDAHDAIRVLHDRNMFIFLSKLQEDFPTRDMTAHRQEVGIRIQQFMFGRKTGLLPGSPFPPDLELFRERAIPMTDRRQVDFAFQYMNIIKAFFSYASDPSTTFNQEDLHLHPRISEFLHHASDQICTMLILIKAEYARDDTYSLACTAYKNLLNFISESLLRHVAPDSGHARANTIKLLYFAAIYTEPIERAFVERESDMLAPYAHTDLLAAIRTVKAHTIDKHGVDVEVEGRFATKEYEGRIVDAPRFTPEWWSFLDRGRRRREDFESGAKDLSSVLVFTQTEEG